MGWRRHSSVIGRVYEQRARECERATGICDIKWFCDRGMGRRRLSRVIRVYEQRVREYERANGVRDIEWFRGRGAGLCGVKGGVRKSRLSASMSLNASL